MKDKRPIIGLTMGDPVGIGPEIVLKALRTDELFDICRPVVFGDLKRLAEIDRNPGANRRLRAVSAPEPSGGPEVQVIDLSNLNSSTIRWGCPTPDTGRAMIAYITAAADMALSGWIDAVVTAPIHKTALKMAGCPFAGHTELLANRTGATRFAMMMNGARLRVVLVTIHIPLSQVPAQLSQERILETIEITNQGLGQRFGIHHPRIAVAALNPHAGEEGMFGDEEARIITPACRTAQAKGYPVLGPFPPDTVFYQAAEGAFDAVVCMYHDQGLIPFKLIHFTDGVNTTLVLPIIRTSVDHGTAYDIAGTGKADIGSLMAAVRSAVEQAKHAGSGQP